MALTRRKSSPDPYIEALLIEREGYERHGLAERVAEVDAEIKRAKSASSKPSPKPAKDSTEPADDSPSVH